MAKTLSLSVLSFIWVLGTAVGWAQVACEALLDARNLTIVSARLVEATDSSPQYCYVRGIISPYLKTGISVS